MPLPSAFSFAPQLCHQTGRVKLIAYVADEVATRAVTTIFICVFQPPSKFPDIVHVLSIDGSRFYRRSQRRSKKAGHKDVVNGNDRLSGAPLRTGVQQLRRQLRLDEITHAGAVGGKDLKGIGRVVQRPLAGPLGSSVFREETAQ